MARPAPASPPVQTKPKAPAPVAVAKPAPTGPAPKKDGQPARIPMVIQKIPPFNPSKAKGANASATATTQEKEKEKEKEDNKEDGSNSPIDPAVKLNANASPFRLKPNAPTFKPVVVSVYAPFLSCHMNTDDVLGAVTITKVEVC